MARHFQPRNTSADNVRIIARAIPWKLLLLLPLLIVLAVPTYIYANRLGMNVFPAITNFFYTMGSAPPSPTPTALPAYPTQLPQAGAVLYTVQVGDSCDEILVFQMRMAKAGQVFSDVNPTTVQALNKALGQDCHALQPGMVLPLSPQYPLTTIAGVVLKIDAATPQQVLPTPLINVPNQPQLGPDCSNGCSLTVQIAPAVRVHLQVQTTLTLRVGSWVWAQAMMPRKKVAGFDAYPYVDPTTSLNGASFQACDFQVDTTHDDNSLSCDQITPNTIDADNGSWLFGVTGQSALDHWHYHLNVPAGTRVLIWLTNVNGTLKFDRGNPAYKYDDTSHLYVKI